MNDPGLDEPISNDAKDVENQAHDERDEREEDEQEFLAPRYELYKVSVLVRPKGALEAKDRASYPCLIEQN